MNDDFVNNVEFIRSRIAEQTFTLRRKAVGNVKV